MTKTHDRNALSAGLALGLIACGHDCLPQTDKMNLEFAFQHAWRKWKHRARFPTIKLDGPGTVDTILQMTHATVRKQVPYLYWARDDDDHSHVIRARHSATPFDVDIEGLAHYLDSHISVEAWRELAADFLDDLDTEH